MAIVYELSPTTPPKKKYIIKIAAHQISKFIIPIGPNRRNYHFEMFLRTYHSDCTLYSGQKRKSSHYQIFLYIHLTLLPNHLFIYAAILGIV